MIWLPGTSKLSLSGLGHVADLRPPMSLNDRMYYLAQALTSAKSAASLGSEDVEFTSSLQERIDVAQVQTEVGRAIAGHKEMAADEKTESLKQLDSRLLGLDEVSYIIPGLGLTRSYTKVTHVHSGYTSPSSSFSRLPTRGSKMSAKLFGGSCYVNSQVLRMKGSRMR